MFSLLDGLLKIYMYSAVAKVVLHMHGSRIVRIDNAAVLFFHNAHTPVIEINFMNGTI